jgi:tetratricopeptide (TPR) repeat protein
VRALLLGEPGLGKSRLLAEFAAGRRVLGVQGRPGDAGVPYATLSRLLRTILERAPVELPAPRRTELARLLPELAPSVPLPADGQRLLLQGAVEAVLAQAQVDGERIDGVIVDDLHFADAASVEMLQALVCGSDSGATPHRRGLALGTGTASRRRQRRRRRAARHAGRSAGARHRAAGAADGRRDGRADRLARPARAGQRAARPAAAKHTGGNPLYALETLKQGLASGLLQQGRLPTPVNVGALIERRLKQLSERALALARVAAIAGVDFSIALAEHVTGVRAVELADAWGELEAAQVLRESAFAHDLVYDAVLRSVPEAIARHLHRAVARLLQSSAGRAGAHRRSLGVRRYREAQACFERAARLYEMLGERQAHFLALQGAVDEAALLDGDRTTYQSLCERLIAAAPDDGQRAHAMVYRLRALEVAGDAEALLRGADEVIALAQASGQPRAEAVGRSGRATAIAALGRFEEAAALYSDIAALGAKTGDPELEGFGYASRAVMFIRLGRHSEALVEFERARVLYARHEYHLRLIMVEQQMSVILASRGYAAEGLAAAERALSLAQRIEMAADVDGHCHLARAMALRALGRYAEALAEIESVLPRLEAAQTWVLARVQLEQAHLFLELGRTDHARRLLGRVRDDALLPAGEQPRLVALDLLLRASAADPVATADTAPARSMANDVSVEPRRRCELLRTLAQCTSGAERQARLEQALRLAADSDLPHEHCTARALLACDLARAGQAGVAAELMRMALADTAIVPAGYPPVVLECATEVWQAAGEAERARETLHRALAWIDAAGGGLSDELRASFLERNPVNRRLLEQRRRLPATRN